MNDAHPLGHITDYVIKIGFQMRGSSHAHCLLWVKDAPKINQDSDDDVYRFIDKYITAVMPKGVLESESDAILIKSLQKHIHSDYCHRNKSCCFEFPKPPASRTSSHANLLKKIKLMTLSSMQKMYYKRCRMFYHLFK